MRAASRETLATLRRAQEPALDRELPTSKLTELADELYGVADLLVGQLHLRRTLADAATSPDARAALIGGLLADRVGPATTALVQSAVRGRWSSPWDLVDALELAADDAAFAAAERDGVLDEVEDELFRFERILDGQPRLTTLLDEAAVEPERRLALLNNVLASKVHPITLALLRHAVASLRKPGLAPAVHDLLDEAAARRERSVARVLSAVELTDAQLSRLAAALTEMYGRSITVRTAIDPGVRGGLVVRVGDEIIDGSVASRLATARTALAS